jgi:hypothetical protein
MRRSCEKRGRREQFEQLPYRRRLALLAAFAVQLALLVTAQVDLQRREPSEVRSDKRLWRAVCLINFVGPLAYFRWGRRDRSA